ncbi:MAG: hypothetical protein DMF54_01020 [Acidobacteria bacterium]|nr:MAG: hypothetical protein DMF55_00600 [Acidobacteriota bacterium]PYQ68329.1 MAG: hypothetical protein DMF54_01020 [Acidobacteriota bacterium]
MKRIGLGLALAACAQAALAARPVVIGTNGSGPLSLAANVGWVRTGAYWSTVEPAPGQWDWNVADAIVDGARANGQQVLYILSGAPQWACGCTNGAARPANIELWKDFVSHVALHMKGRVAAYEIWNEPDLTANTTYGVGWDADLNASPRYVDYLVEAARIIRSTDGAVRLVGPALSGGANSRTAQIFQQLENTTYPDGNASAFVDVVSVHANAHDDWTAADAANRLWWNKLYPLQTYNPRNSGKPIWVTEFGWSSEVIGEAAQRDRIRDFLIQAGGESSLLAPFRITHAFIYALFTGCGGQDIYRCDQTPKLAVTDYLRTLPFPAVQPLQPSASPEGMAFFTLPPCRVVDTRNPTGPAGGPALAAHSRRVFPIALACGVPATARAIASNLTVTGGNDFGYVVLSPGEPPPTSTINYRPGQTRANNAMTGVNAVGSVTAGSGQISGSVHVIIDVNGYFE